jgi:hypothetical protein
MQLHYWVARLECFQTKNPNSGKFWRVFQWKMIGYLMAIRHILRPLSIFCVIWYIFSSFGKLYQEKSGNSAPLHEKITIWFMHASILKSHSFRFNSVCSNLQSHVTFLMSLYWQKKHVGRCT